MTKLAIVIAMFSIWFSGAWWAMDERKAALWALGFGLLMLFIGGTL
jgi:hypothetical protein